MTGLTRDQVIERLAAMIRDELYPDFHEAPPPEWAQRAAAKVIDYHQPMLRDLLLAEAFANGVRAGRSERDAVRAELERFVRFVDSCDPAITDAFVFAEKLAPAPRETAAAPALDPWADLMAEARAFEAWYTPTRLSVNAWVGVDTTGGLYGGWSVEGDHLYDEWDDSEMMTATGDTPEAVIASLIGIARHYRERRDAERAEDEAARLSASGDADQ